MNLSNLIEAILFFKAEPISIKVLAEITNTSLEEVGVALTELETALTGRGVALLRKDNEVSLGTAPEAAAVIEKMIKEELSRDLGKAGLETLSIVLYKGPISRPEIDYIRGVNSSFILRNLTVRGLVERLTKEGDSRAYVYRPTFELLSQLGITQISDLPDYDIVTRELEVIMNQPEAA
jgi:segregation and condensation protein B